MADVEIPKPKVAIRIVIAGIGSFLLAAAGLKAHGFLVDPLSHDSLLGFPRFQIAIIEAEIILGLWLLSGWRMRQAWAVALALFVILASASLYLALDKQNSCGCFGQIKVNPWLTLSLDLGAIAGLLFWRPNRRQDFFAESRFSRVMKAGAATVLFLILLGGESLLGYENARQAFVWLRGEGMPGPARVILTTSTWEKQAYHIFEDADNADELRQGNWLIMLYRADCPACAATLADYSEWAATHRENSKNLKFAVLQVPDESTAMTTPPNGSGKLVFGRIRGGHRWIVQTPFFLRSRNGRFVGGVANLSEFGS